MLLDITAPTLLNRSSDIALTSAPDNIIRAVPREDLRDKKEQQHEKVAEEVKETVRVVEMCLECLLNNCDQCVGHNCRTCEKDQAVCGTCRPHHRHWQNERKKCDRCRLRGLKCVRLKIYIIESDKEACNKKALGNLCGEGGELFGMAFPVFGIQHGLKSAVGPIFNWY